jgi:hypothetical protein
MNNDWMGAHFYRSDRFSVTGSRCPRPVTCLTLKSVGDTGRVDTETVSPQWWDEHSPNRPNRHPSLVTPPCRLPMARSHKFGDGEGPDSPTTPCPCVRPLVSCEIVLASHTVSSGCWTGKKNSFTQLQYLANSNGGVTMTGHPRTGMGNRN